MRVGLVSTACFPILGGVQVCLRELAHGLVAQGHEVVVATRFASRHPGSRYLTARENPRSYRDDGVTVQVVSPGPVGRALVRLGFRLHFYGRTEAIGGWLYGAAFAGMVRRTLAGCEVVHYHGVGRELLGFAAAAAARRMGVPFLITPHLHIGSWGDSSLDFRLYCRADGLLADTEVERRFLIERGVPADRVHVVGCGVRTSGTGSAERFRQRLGHDGSIILFLGRKAVYKGYRLLLDAAPLVWERFPDAAFVLAGPEESEPVPHPALADPRVHNLAPLSDAEKEDALAACDIFCLPSEAEAFGIVYVEAWRYRKPVVALDIPTCRELIGNSAGGLVVPPGAQYLSKAIAQLLSQPDLRDRLARAGHEVSRKYEPVNVVRAHAEIYRDVDPPA